tara:strand:+ start:109 stop:219 length:111 start_codon:yes stop_codon:yes gene_type:complete
MKDSTRKEIKEVAKFLLAMILLTGIALLGVYYKYNY